MFVIFPQGFFAFTSVISLENPFGGSVQDILKGAYA